MRFRSNLKRSKNEEDQNPPHVLLALSVGRSTERASVRRSTRCLVVAWTELIRWRGSVGSARQQSSLRAELCVVLLTTVCVSHNGVLLLIENKRHRATDARADGRTAAATMTTRRRVRGTFCVAGAGGGADPSRVAAGSGRDISNSCS